MSAAAPTKARQTDGSGRPRRRWAPPGVIAAAGAGLGGFVLLSQALPPVPFGRFRYPPIYGFWDPVLDRLALTVIPTGVLLVVAGFLFTSTRRGPAWVWLGLLIGCGVAAAAAVALVRGDFQHLIRGVSTAADVPYYTSDLHWVYEYGIRGFAERHPDLASHFHSYSSRTHPPGVHLLLYGLFQVFGAHPLRITTVLAAVSMSAVITAWSMGRTLGGERSGRISAVLFVTAPGPLLLAYTSMDAVFATFLAGAAALFMLATARSSAVAAVAGGAVLGIGTLMTYAVAFVAIAATAAILIEAPGVRNKVRLLVAAAAGGLAILALARLGLGVDILASYLASPKAGRAYQPYWIVGSPAAVLIYAGLPLAGLGVAGLVRKVPGARRAILPLALVAVMVIWAALPTEVTKLRPGEVERTWAFLYPVLAAAAGPYVDRWIREGGRWSPAVLPVLAGLGLLQAVLLQALWDGLF